MSETLPHERLVIAMDGPAGSGKSSVARAVAERLGAAYLDTGSAYRALAWHVLETGAEPGDGDAVRAALRSFEPSISLDAAAPGIRVAGVDVTAAIREARVTDAVSAVARVPEARRALTEWFRQLMAEAPAGVVAEGRDITTVVAPDAPVRVLLTASPEVRAARRGTEVGAAGAARDEVAKALHRRDAADSAVNDFLTAAPGVSVVDSTELGFDETVDAVLALVPGPAADDVREA